MKKKFKQSETIEFFNYIDQVFTFFVIKINLIFFFFFKKILKSMKGVITN